MRIMDALRYMNGRDEASAAGRFPANAPDALRHNASAKSLAASQDERSSARDRYAWSWSNDSQPLLGSAMDNNLLYTKAVAQITGENADDTRKSVAAGTPAAQETDGSAKIAEPKTRCETCEERQYQDGSDDAGVSFQAATGLPASTAGSRIAAHEGEHVSREKAKAQEEGAIVTQEKVTIQMGICPECGRTYAAGGTTTIQTAGGENSLPPAYAQQETALGLLLDATA